MKQPQHIMKQPPNCLKNIKYFFFFLMQSFLDVNVDFKRALVSNIAKLLWLTNETFCNKGRYFRQLFEDLTKGSIVRYDSVILKVNRIYLTESKQRTKTGWFLLKLLKRYTF